MMPAAYVKPYVRRQMNDAADAAGICEAVTEPSMRFIGVRALVGKSEPIPTPPPATNMLN